MDELRLTGLAVVAGFIIGVAGTASAGLKGTIKLGEDEGGAMFAGMAKVSFHKVVKTAEQKAGGKVSWMAMENIDGYLFHMATVVAKDRSIKVVTLDSGTGKVVAVEPRKEGKKEKEKEKEAKKIPFTGTLKAGDAKEADYPYLAKIPLEKAMKIAETKYPGKFYEIYIYEANGFLFYGIEIARKGKKGLFKIDVDAGTGKIANTEEM